MDENNKVAVQKTAGKRSFKLYILPALVAVVLIVSTFVLGVYIGVKKAPSALAGDDSSIADLDLFWKVWRTLDGKFVGEVNPTDAEKVYGAIQGLTASYKDPYTVFFPPVEAKAFNEEVSGAFEGVGMEVGMRDGGLVVVAPLKDTPAFKAGILAGDKIIKIDGADTAGLAVDQAVKKIRGKGGTKVVLTIVREGKEPMDISIVRAQIDIPTVNTELRKDGVFVIHLYNFSAPSFAKFREALREFVDSKSDKLIIDLRNNPGGYLEAASDIGSWFLPTGDLIVTEDYSDKRDQIAHRSKGYNVFTDKLHLAILVNGGSASASEILAGALHDHKKATLVGEKTFGKGSVQELVQLDNNTSLKVTVARWLTPSGLNISKQGIMPDIEVKMTPEIYKEKGDVQLNSAAEFLVKESAQSSGGPILNSVQNFFK